MAKAKGDKFYRVLKQKMAGVVARHLGVRRPNKVLFPAVAAVLGKTWKPGQPKAFGYEMVMEYARIHNLRAFKSSKIVPPKPLLPIEARDEFLLSYEWRKLRMVVLKERGARCECCGASPKDGKTVINIDHIKPRRLFPELALEQSNLQVLCHECNHGKGNWDQTDWRSEVQA